MKNNKKVLSNVDGATVKRLLSYLFQYRAKLILVVVCILISSGASVASSLFIGTLIDDYISPLLLEADPVFTGLLTMLATMGLLYLCGVLASLIYNRTMASVSQGVLKDIRDTMFSKMQDLPIRYFDVNSNGDIMSHYTNDTDTLRQMISQTIPQLFSSLISVIAVFCAMVSISLWLTLFVVVFLFLMLFVIKLIAGKSGHYFVAQQQSLGTLNGFIEEMISGQKVVKVFCREHHALQDFNDRNEKLFQNADKANTFANILMPIMNSMGYLLYVLIAVLGGILSSTGVPNLTLLGFGAITLGMIASFLQLSRSIVQPIANMSQQMNSVAMAIAGAKRIFALMDETPEADEGYVTLVNAEKKNGVLTETARRTGLWAWKHPHSDGTVTYTELTGDIQMDSVDFGYTTEKTVLHEVSLYANPGQKLAFVGATGAGKTTITNLINRFYDIADGKIRYDGININKIKKADLRRSLGVVLQDVNLFTGTILENIRYGKLDATDEECIAAAKLTNAHSFIRRLPKGYQTELSGSELSQGQRQLISIARAAVADPPVMILDEATSSIDTRTEAIVQRGMDSLMEGRTVFVIAHRLSTIMNSNVIMVLDKGRIVERGTHDQLMEEKGLYYRLHTGAFELS